MSISYKEEKIFRFFEKVIDITLSVWYNILREQEKRKNFIRGCI